jgi:hypothetical protein
MDGYPNKHGTLWKMKVNGDRNGDAFALSQPYEMIRMYYILCHGELQITTEDA